MVYRLVHDRVISQGTSCDVMGSNLGYPCVPCMRPCCIPKSNDSKLESTMYHRLSRYKKRVYVCMYVCMVNHEPT